MKCIKLKIELCVAARALCSDDTTMRRNIKFIKKVLDSYVIQSQFWDNFFKFNFLYDYERFSRDDFSTIE